MMKKKKKQRSAPGSPPGLTAENYLKRLVKLKRGFYALNRYEAVALCANELSVHVYRGIDVLAAAAGTPLTVVDRGDDTYPQELSFTHDGITFYQLTATESLRALSQ